jgi:cysteine synthase A
MIYNSILETIGSTPHLKLNKLFGSKQQVFLKLERNNPGGSIKDRIALAMIENAEQNGFLVIQVSDWRLWRRIVVIV